MSHVIGPAGEGMTRQALLVRGILAVGATYGAAAVTPFVRSALAAPYTTDVSILNLGLMLEYLEAAFYDEALSSAPLSGEALRLAKEFADNETEHVKGMVAALNDLKAEPDPPPGFDWGESMRSQKAFLKAAVQLEDTVVSAFNGAAPQIQDKQLLAGAGSIVQVDARQAALLRGLTGQPPTVAAFDQTLTEEQVLDLVAPYVQE